MLANGDGKKDKPSEQLPHDLGPDLGVARSRWARPRVALYIGCLSIPEENEILRLPLSPSARTVGGQYKEDSFSTGQFPAQWSPPGREECPSFSQPFPGETEDCHQWPLFTLPEEQNRKYIKHFKPFLITENNQNSNGDLTLIMHMQAFKSNDFFFL